MQALRLYAGPKARQHIEQHGLRPQDVGTVPAAAGGPKGLILGPLDRFIFGHWLTQSAQPVHLVGASIGAWRMATACLDDSVAAFERLERDYIAQHYELPPAFFGHCLGARFKYSSCYYPTGTETLDQAEDAMLALYGDRAQLADGQVPLLIGVRRAVHVVLDVAVAVDRCHRKRATAAGRPAHRRALVARGHHQTHAAQRKPDEFVSPRLQQRFVSASCERAGQRLLSGVKTCRSRPSCTTPTPCRRMSCPSW